MSADDIAGGIFDRPDMLETAHENGHTTLDVTSLLSSDKKFASGMYKSGKVRIEIDEPYGVDEFMYFLEGSVIPRNGQAFGKPMATPRSG
jgi:hypothetical protein